MAFLPKGHEFTDKITIRQNNSTKNFQEIFYRPFTPPHFRPFCDKKHHFVTKFSLAWRTPARHPHLHHPPQAPKPPISKPSTLVSKVTLHVPEPLLRRAQTIAPPCPNHPPFCPPFPQFRGQTEVETSVCPPNSPIRGQTEVEASVCPPKRQFRGQTRVETSICPLNSPIPWTN